MFDFVNYTAPTGAVWAQVQKKLGYSNSQMAQVLDISPSKLKRFRDYIPPGPGETEPRKGQKPDKGAFFFMCVLANETVIIFDEPEEPGEQR